MTTRRHFLLGTAGLALAGCAGTTTPPAPGQYQYIADDVKLAADTLAGLLAYIPLADATRARYQGYVDQVSTAVQAIVTAVDKTSAQSAVSQAIAAIQAALDLASGYPNIPSAALTAITAIRFLLPILGTFVGMFMAAPRTRVSMTPDQARATLRAFVARSHR